MMVKSAGTSAEVSVAMSVGSASIQTCKPGRRYRERARAKPFGCARGEFRLRQLPRLGTERGLEIGQPPAVRRENR